MNDDQAIDGFFRISAAIPRCEIADVSRNREEILTLWQEAAEHNVSLVVFPELSLSSYALRDLFLSQTLQQACLEALDKLAAASSKLGTLALVGAPLRMGDRLYNTAVAIHRGEIVAVIPKSYLPMHGEFEEGRWFRSGLAVPAGESIVLGATRVPFGTDILLQESGSSAVIGIELCEDLWVPVPPSSIQVSSGATIVANLSASNFTIGKREIRRTLARGQSDRGKCAYIYVAAGPGESSTDLAFDADSFIYENGHLVAESARFSRASQLITYDVDIQALRHDRTQESTFGICDSERSKSFRTLPFSAYGWARSPLRRRIDPHPFLPSEYPSGSAQLPQMGASQAIAQRCTEVIEVQANALATRMEGAASNKVIVGISGGLDSTHAALICARALDVLGLERSNLLAITLPGLGTSEATRINAESLARALGASFREIPTENASETLLTALDHPATRLKMGQDRQTAQSTARPNPLLSLKKRLQSDPDLADLVVENVQARLRTLLLMGVANTDSALVVGTGDLSEKALGWSTYAGDHISMYDINAGVPKTLIRFIVGWIAKNACDRFAGEDHRQLLGKTLRAVLETPISPELVPPQDDGSIAQLSEETIGPYELHDFFLYHLLRHGAGPSRILDLARIAFAARYTPAEVKKWLRVFVRRFFANQFKRSCATDGPKVGMVSLSPRGDWRMPSDATPSLWLDEIDRYPL